MSENKKDEKKSFSEEDIRKINEKLQSLKSAFTQDGGTEKPDENSGGDGKNSKSEDGSADAGSDSGTIANIFMQDPDPEKVYVIPTFNRPIMPSQIVPIQVKGNYEQIISDIAKSDSKCFAIFALDEKLAKTGRITRNNFPKTGTLVRLLHAKSVPGEIHFVCEGLSRIQIKEWVEFGRSNIAYIQYPETVEPSPDSEDAVKVTAFAMDLVASLQQLLPLNPLYSDEMRQYLMRFDQNDPSMLADCAASVTTSSQKKLQEVLDTYDILERLKLAQAMIKKEIKAAKLQDKIKSSVSEKMSKRQKDYVLREQLKEIQKELGTRADSFAESDEFSSRMKKLSPPDFIRKRFDSELKKLNMLDQNSPEYGGTRNYLDILTTIPWGQYAKEEIDLDRARTILDRDHEGLKDVKDRIIEFLALAKLKGTAAGSILLFVGPPGVGKTSIGKSIAEALNRPFYRLSLGGVNDESVIKGHRRTYIGAMPGKFVQALRESEVMNPVIMLDEIDKLTTSYHGDPSSALLETLDPEQNSSFMDNYIDEKLDLSKCLFICTANTTDPIQAPLLDRMDPIRLSGYILQEKLAIAKKHLLPKGLEKASLTKSQFKISDAVLRKVIEKYARESGMRSTERAINRLIRKAAVKIVGGEKSVSIRADELFDYLGTAPFRREKHLQGVGIITGLAWTSVGGATLPVEASRVSDDSKGFELTGSLGDVMKESAHIAYSYIQANIGKFAPKKKDFFKKALIHLHVPEGATPKDGPSAGVTMASSLLSLALGKAPQKGFAMTGELSLTGQVLAIGGIREKTIAARRMGISSIICPKANESDVNELPKEVTEGVRYYFADTFEDVAKVIFKL